MAMETAMLKLGGTRLVGSPPKGPFETHLSKLLAKLKQETGEGE